jgi:hypothetical protein
LSLSATTKNITRLFSVMRPLELVDAEALRSSGTEASCASGANHA